MRILLIDSGIGRIYRGVERFTINLAVNLAKMNEEVIVISRVKPKDFNMLKNITHICSPIIHRESLFYWKRPFEEISSSVEVLSLSFSSFFKISRIQFDVAIVNHFSDAYLLPFLKKVKGINIKLVCVLHSTPRIISLPFHLPVVFADKAICVSNYVKEKLKRLLPIRDAVTIYNGVDTGFFKPIKEMRKEENTILFVGALLKKKGIFTLLKVAKRMKNTNFWIVGDGPEKERVRRLAKKLKNVSIFLKVSDETLVKLYSSATLTVIPSQYPEALSIVPLESFSCGTPVLASDIGGLGEITKLLGGVTFVPGNEMDLEEKIVYLLESERVRKKIGSEGRRRVKKSFDWKVIARSYLKEIKRIL